MSSAKFLHTSSYTLVLLTVCLQQSSKSFTFEVKILPKTNKETILCVCFVLFSQISTQNMNQNHNSKQFKLCGLCFSCIVFRICVCTYFFDASKGIVGSMFATFSQQLITVFDVRLYLCNIELSLYHTALFGLKGNLPPF